MPLSYDEVAAALAHLTAAQGFPLPPRPIDRENAIAMYQVAEAVAHAFIGDGPGHPPWVSGVSEGAQNWARDVIEVAEPAMERLEWLADHVKVFKGKVEGNFMSTFGAPDGHEGKRPLIKLLFGAGEERAFHYITRKVAGMLAGSRDLRSVDARLFVGYRDWHSPSSTAWLRAKTLLAAHEYERVRTNLPSFISSLACFGGNGSQPLTSLLLSTEQKVLAEHARRQAAANAAQIVEGLHTNSLAQITARQARRSGVTAEGLRRRWA